MVKRSVKLLMTVLVGLVLLFMFACGGLALYLKNMDFNSYKPLFKEAMFEAIGRNMDIDGVMELTLSMHPLLTVDGLHLANVAGGSRTNMMNVGRMEIQLSLMPLLGGKLKVDRVYLIAPDILLETLPSGANNWSFENVSDQGDERETIEKATESDALLIPQIQQIVMRDVQIHYHDSMAEEDRSLTLTELAFDQLPNDTRLSLRGQGKVNRDNLQFSGMIDDLPGLLANRVIQLQAFQAEYVGMHISFSGSIAQPLDAQGMNLNLLLETDSMNPAAKAFDFELPHDFPLKMQMGITDSDDGFQFSDIELKMADSDLSGALNLNLMGEHPSIDGLLHSINVDVTRFLPLDAQNATLTQAPVSEIEDTVPQNKQAILPAEAIDFSALKMADVNLELQLKLLKLPNVELHDVDTKINLANGVLALNPFSLIIAGGEFPDSDLSGDLSLNITGERPSLDGKLSSTDFDLTRFLPVEEKDSRELIPSDNTAQKQPAKQRLFSAEEIDFSPLKLADIALGLQLKRLKLPDLELLNLDANIHLKNGELALNPFSLGVAGGRMGGSVKLASMMPQPSIAMTLKIADMQPSFFLPVEKDGKTQIEGAPVNADITFTGSGKSIAEMMAHGDGELLVKLGKGRIQSQALRFIGGDVLMNLANTLNPFAEKMDYNVLQCGVVHFRINNGDMHTRNGIAFETDRMNVISSGHVNLASEKINLSINTETREGLGLNVSNMVNVVKLGGTLVEPGITVDAGKTGMVAARTVGAIASGGLSIIGESLIKRVIVDTSPCDTAVKMAE
ncbi:AsmA family protein [Mariprofundus sp. EBB-1]|uniref:AsmA family protein n=1 Tax=Mariprofundus sp. EBB-1 TaxID=2650971 RepID=UPI000EF175F3|nr:AsmA family protein [Mariprofundus sp. EBB-1]RLL51071.1 AsmA family protein [Mariprofundus sp. EBB-1]